MKRVLLPRSNAHAIVDKVIVSDEIVLGTSTGLVKTSNEDALGFTSRGGVLRLCIADGHWGSEAAQHIARFWLEDDEAFPASKRRATTRVKRLEKELFQRFGWLGMSEDKDFTPEAAFIAIEQHGCSLRIVSYGDCRMLVARKQRIAFQLATTPTWLGAFSHLAIRSRLPVKTALIFKELALQNDDHVALFTDGIDQCVYEKPTISLEHIRELLTKAPSDAFDAIFEEVIAEGAEDNASLAIIRIRRAEL